MRSGWPIPLFVARIFFAFLIITLGACSTAPPTRSASRASASPLPAAPSSYRPPSAIAGVQVSSFQDAPYTRADSFILIDAHSGETLAAKNADIVRAVASTQKLVTALIILDAGDLDRRVVIQSSDTWVEPSKLYLRAGESYTRRDLLHAILIKSANDAAVALARDNAGSLEAFSHKMNGKARQLGAMQSRFANPHGLTVPGQFSTARDVARIAYHAYNHPTIRSIVNRSEYNFPTPRGPKRIESTNKLLKRMTECNGMKTGYTKASGRCLVSTAANGSRHVLLVQLGSKTAYIFDDAETLMNWGLTQSPSMSRIVSNDRF